MQLARHETSPLLHEPDHYEDVFRNIPYCLHDFFKHEWPQESARTIWEDMMSVVDPAGEGGADKCVQYTYNETQVPANNRYVVVPFATGETVDAGRAQDKCS